MNQKGYHSINFQKFGKPATVGCADGLMSKSKLSRWKSGNTSIARFSLGKPATVGCVDGLMSKS
jgi:hypothetical protein